MNLRNRFEERIWTMNLRNGFEQRNESEEWTWRMDLKNGFEERIKEKERNKLKNGWKGYIKQIIWNTLDTKLPSLGILPNLIERFQLGWTFPDVSSVGVQSTDWQGLAPNLRWVIGKRASSNSLSRVYTPYLSIKWLRQENLSFWVISLTN